MADTSRKRRRHRHDNEKKVNDDTEIDFETNTNFSLDDVKEMDENMSERELYDQCISVETSSVNLAIVGDQNELYIEPASLPNTDPTSDAEFEIISQTSDEENTDINEDWNVGQTSRIEVHGLDNEEVERLVNSELLSSDPELDKILQHMYEESLLSSEANESVLYSGDSDYELQQSDEEDNENVTADQNSQDVSFESEPLYAGAEMTIGAFMLLLGLYFTKHNSTGDAIVQLLNILAIALPNGNRICTSLSAFKKFFCKLKNPLVHHYYCGHCLGYIGEHVMNKCPYSVCGKDFDRREQPYFLEMSLENQLKNLFAQEGFSEKLKGRFCQRSEAYADIYDGSLYKTYFENGGPLSNPDNVSFTFNTDGAPVFKSSKVSMWPLFLVINELPYQMRMKRENMILAGLWFGSQKPSMGTFLCPFLKTFNKLSEGIECVSADKGTIVCKGFLLCGTADLPARCLLCNSIQFNGAFSCWKCKQRGETAKVGKGHAHIFPFDPENPKGPERTKNNVIHDAKTALDNRETGSKEVVVNGIKGPSWLSFFPRFDIVDGIAIDYMHGILLGVQKLLLKVWFTQSHKGKPYNFNDQVHEVDKRLSQIKPTLDISRLPRSIYNDLKHWKASEFRSFLLYYGAPVLYGILDSNRFAHYLLLVNAMHVLLKYGATVNEVNKAETMLYTFCERFSHLYDKCFNIHQLVHLADSVRNLGPLYTHSCFSFEDKNGFMLKMIRGTQNIDNQIITGISFLQKLPELKQKFIVKHSDIEKLYESIDSLNILKRVTKLGTGIYVLGALKSRTLLKDEYTEMCHFLGCIPLTDSFRSFNRIELHNNILYSSEYARMTKRDNSCILFNDNDRNDCFGCVRCFLLVTNEHNTNIAAPCAVSVVESFECPTYDKSLHILSVQRTNHLKIVPLKHIKESCMFISLVGSNRGKDRMYICKFPNKLELD